MLLWVKPMVRDFPWFGVGRGSFESVFPAYRTASGNVSFSHAETPIEPRASQYQACSGTSSVTRKKVRWVASTFCFMSVACSSFKFQSFAGATLARAHRPNVGGCGSRLVALACATTMAYA